MPLPESPFFRSYNSIYLLSKIVLVGLIISGAFSLAAIFLAIFLGLFFVLDIYALYWQRKTYPESAEKLELTKTGIGLHLIAYVMMSLLVVAIFVVEASRSITDISGWNQAF